jgi:hypothetical protein
MAAFNLFIAYDLMWPGQNYDAVQAKIKELGLWQQFQFSLFYVNTPLTPQQAYAHVVSAMDFNDKLIVINAVSGVVSSPQWVADAVNRVWFSPMWPAPVQLPRFRF